MIEKDFEKINKDFLELCILKGLLEDKHYALLVTSSFKNHYFNSPEMTIIFDEIKSYLNDFKKLPSFEIIENSIDEKNREMVSNYFKEMKSFDFDYKKNYDWLLEATNLYLKDKAIKQAIMESVDIIDSNKNVVGIKKIIEEALCKDLKINLGQNYFENLGERLEKIFNTTEEKIPTGFPCIDDVLNGGLPPLTLSVWAAVVHGGKSLLMANMIARQILLGYNSVLFTLEMSEDAFAQRFDSIFSLLDTNRMYIRKDLKGELLKSLIKIKNKKDRGNLWIKEMPTGKASVNDFRMYLRELKMRDQKIDCVYCDYINLMRPEYKSKGGMYEDIKSIAVDLRALAFEFNVPVVSVTQLNREGSFINLKETNFNHISESSGVAATADMVGILGHDDDQLLYNSEIHYKISKNRMGRSGDINKLYMDKRSLKLYSEQEFDQWIEDAKISKDDRDLAKKE